MTGQVTDQSGAAVPNAAITLTNTTTGIKYTTTSNSTGFYRFAQLPPGQGYLASFSAQGFATTQVTGIYLTVGNVRTQNAALSVGTTVSTVQVTAAQSEVTLDTTDATIGNNMDVQHLNELPVQQRDSPTALFELQAGVTDTGSVTGARVDQNYITVDGLDVNDIATGGVAYNSSPNGIQEGIRQLTLVSGAPIDSVEQFTGSVAGEQADSGQGSGGQFALVTKSGTNHFHGNLNEYHRDAALVANSWFSNNAVPIVPRNNLIQNQFGGNIGGPVKRDKLFFFFDFNDSRLIRSMIQQRTVPLGNMRNGVLGYYDNTSTLAAPSISYLTPSQVAAMDPRGTGEDATWMSAIDARFPTSNNFNSGDGINSSGYLFNAPDNDTVTTYVSRVDLNISDKQKAFAKFSINRENGVFNPNQFAGDGATSQVVDRSYSFVLGHTWIPTPSITNRFAIGEVVQKLTFPINWQSNWVPQESTSFTFADGTGPALLSPMYLTPNSQARRVPIEQISDDFTWTKGSHTWQAGGDMKGILAHFTNVADFNTAYVGMGGNVLNLCGPTPGACGGANASLRPGNIYVAPGNASKDQANFEALADYNWDYAFTTTLARIGNVQEDFNYDKNGNALKQLTGDQRFYQNYQLQMYLQDSWRILPSVTVTYGLNYQFYSVPYETRGLESVEPFTFDQYFQARAQQSAESQTGNLAVPLIAYYLGGKGNGSSAPPLYKPEYRLIAPHVGFAWNPTFDRKMVINGGASIAYDRTIVFSLEQIQDVDSYLFQQTLPVAEGIKGDPYDSVKNDPRLDAKNDISGAYQPAPATPRPPYEPYVYGGVPLGLQLGTAFNATIDPSLKTPYSIVYNFGIQRQIPGDMVLKTSYVGRLGRRLLGQADAEQLVEFVDPTSGQAYSAAFGSIVQQVRGGADYTTVTPQPFFENELGNIGAANGFNSNTALVVAVLGGYVYRGDFADTTEALSGALPPNVGMAPQFSENTFYTNKGFSSYNAFLFTIQKNLSHGLQYDFNYTFAHSIDNVSNPANSQGDTGIGGLGLICDVVRPRECRANSDFDVRHYITSDANYLLPIGKGQMFMDSVPHWADELIGQWALSGIAIFHTGQAWGTVANAFVASYSNDAPGILIGKKSDVATHLTKLQGGGVNIFASQATAASAFVGPIGFKIGPRNELSGPHYFDTDLGLAKTFPVYGEGVNLKFRADAFNAFNHPNFNLPANNVFQGYDQQDFTSSTFGEISTTVEPSGNLNNGARVLQLSLRFEF